MDENWLIKKVKLMRISHVFSHNVHLRGVNSSSSLVFVTIFSVPGFFVLEAENVPGFNHQNLFFDFYKLTVSFFSLQFSKRHMRRDRGQSRGGRPPQPLLTSHLLEETGTRRSLEEPKNNNVLSYTCLPDNVCKVCKIKKQNK